MRIDPNKFRNILTAGFIAFTILFGLGIGYLWKEQKNLEGDIETGFSVVTGYRSSLSSSIASTDASIAVASINDKGGNAIDASVLGNKIYFSIEPGTAREEIVVCQNRSGLSWVGCTRGLSFQGTSEGSSSTLSRAHNAGVPIVMSNVHFIYEQFLDKTTSTAYEEYAGGTYVYSSSTPIYVGPGTGTQSCIRFRLNNSTSTNPYICFTTTQALVSVDGASSFNLTPTSTEAISYGRGLLSTASVLDIATTTSRYPGLRFWLESGKDRLAVATSTANGGKAMYVDAEGIYLFASTTLFSGLGFRSSSTSDGALEFSGQVPYLNVGLGGYISASSTAVSSTLRNLVVVERLSVPNIFAAPTSTGNGLATTTLSGDLNITGGLNFTTLYGITLSRAIGTFSRNLATADGTQEITHGLGVVPTLLQVTCGMPDDGTGPMATISGRATGVSTENSQTTISDGTNGLAIVDGDDLIRVINAVTQSAASGEGGNLSGLTATTFTLTWTQTDAIAETIQCNYAVMR